MEKLISKCSVQHVLGMLQMLMETDLDVNQMDYANTAHTSGKDLIALINEVLDQAKIESGRLELEAVPFDLRSVLDNVLSLFSGKSNEKGIEVHICNSLYCSFSSPFLGIAVISNPSLSPIVLLGERSWLFMFLTGSLKLLLVTLDGFGR
jgi:signal transduction histidine kinase